MLALLLLLLARAPRAHRHNGPTRRRHLSHDPHLPHALHRHRCRAMLRRRHCACRWPARRHCHDPPTPPHRHRRLLPLAVHSINRIRPPRPTCHRRCYAPHRPPCRRGPPCRRSSTTRAPTPPHPRLRAPRAPRHTRRLPRRRHLRRYPHHDRHLALLTTKPLPPWHNRRTMTRRSPRCCYNRQTPPPTTDFRTPHARCQPRSASSIRALAATTTSLVPSGIVRISRHSAASPPPRRLPAPRHCSNSSISRPQRGLWKA